MHDIDYAPLAAPAGDDPSRLLASFATANGGDFFPYAVELPLPGVIFRDERDRPRPSQQAGNIVRFPGPPLLEVGNAMFTTSLRISVFTHLTNAWGYLALQCAVPIPSFVLQPARVSAEQKLPAAPRGHVTATIGSATLSAPDSEFAAAQALVGPALLEALDDGIRAFDLEIAPGWLFLYAPGRLATADPALWQRTFAAADAAARALGIPC